MLGEGARLAYQEIRLSLSWLCRIYLLSTVCFVPPITLMLTLLKNTLLYVFVPHPITSPLLCKKLLLCVWGGGGIGSIHVNCIGPKALYIDIMIMQNGSVKTEVMKDLFRIVRVRKLFVLPTRLPSLYCCLQNTLQTHSILLLRHPGCQSIFGAPLQNLLEKNRKCY